MKSDSRHRWPSRENESKTGPIKPQTFSIDQISQWQLVNLFVCFVLTHNACWEKKGGQGRKQNNRAIEGKKMTVLYESSTLTIDVKVDDQHFFEQPLLAVSLPVFPSVSGKAEREGQATFTHLCSSASVGISYKTGTVCQEGFSPTGSPQGCVLSPLLYRNIHQSSESISRRMYSQICR